MNTFLDKISQLTSVDEVLLLTGDGEPLYCSHKDQSKKAGAGQFETWHKLITELGSPATADFEFEDGRYYLLKMEVGTLLIGMNSDQHFRMIKDGCRNVGQKLGDRAIRKNVLLRLFDEHKQALQPQYVKVLQSVAGADVAALLIPILTNAEKLSATASNGLLSAVCEVLGHCRTSNALKALQDYLRKYEKSGDSSGTSIEAARIGIAQLQLDRLEPAPGGSIDFDNYTLDQNGGTTLSSGKTASFQPALDQLSPAEQEIQLLLKQDKQETAVPRVMKLIRSCVAEKNFAQAERYRQMLIAGAPMALREIISAAELIEEEKSASLDSMLLSTWEELILALSLEEFSALYYQTQPRNSMNGEIIVEQGDFMTSLILVNSGQVQLYTTRQGKDIAFKTVTEGEIFGADTFFDISVWTVSARSLGASLSLLSWDRLAMLSEDYPALQNKLMDYCIRFRVGNAHFAKPATTRRKYERKKLTGRATMDLVDEAGAEAGQVSRGDLLDISQGGVAFVLRFHKKEKAVDLLGKRIKVSVKPDNSASPLLRTGLVKAVRCHDFVGNDYSVHVEFDEALSSTEIAQAAAKKEH